MSAAADIFEQQAFHCRDLGSPFTADLCLAFGKNLDSQTAVGRLINSWAGNPSYRADAVPLRLCGGLHALVLLERDGELHSAYPPRCIKIPDWALIERVLNDHEAFLLDWMKSPPQTNEVQRSNAIWPALQTIAATTKRQIALWEIGASAGLNLQMDRFAFDHGGQMSGTADSAVFLRPNWDGPVPPNQRVEIIDKAACDLNPLDPADKQAQLRLMSYLWPDQEDRKRRTAGALSLAQAHPVVVEKMDAIEWLRERLAHRQPDACTVIYTTIAWQYLPDAAKAQGEAMIRAAGEAATADQPLAQVHMEGDGESPGAAITLKLWPDGVDAKLGRVDFHGRWLKWHGL
ncbi:DUF2332 domain-containing protein [Pseudahrensia aquimaris]|uniref:DUF2332 domain-containing protein n=1 Tax=Pseudahrensia aquimaris TaxID=744461 RepID=A0ABW3FEJ2_9HYPH